MSVAQGGGRVELLAPAKINLGLRVVGRRSDGMHLLESLVLPLDLADEVKIEVRPIDRGVRVNLRLEAPADAVPRALSDVPQDERNLAARAARLFLERAGLHAEVRIALRKRIPAAAGLGGGSSDAGAVLRGLAEIFPTALEEEARQRLALSLGADVPFFLAPRPAIMRGVGERLEPVENLPALALLLANPGDSLATSEVYAICDALGPALTPPRPGSTMRSLSTLGGEADRMQIRRQLAEWAQNDLEAAATRLCPPVGRLGRRLRDLGAWCVGMSGSGATVFGLFDDVRSAGEALLRAEFGERVWARVAVTAGRG